MSLSESEKGRNYTKEKGTEVGSSEEIHKIKTEKKNKGTNAPLKAWQIFLIVIGVLAIVAVIVVVVIKIFAAEISDRHLISSSI